jgi:hypothetical protein
MGGLAIGDRALLSVAAMLAERDARRRREKSAEEQSRRKQEEEVADFKKRLDNFVLTQEAVNLVMDNIKRAFDRGERELMISSFPSGFCTDDGRSNQGHQY